MFNFEGQVRRIDLDLRAEYPEIQTRIFKLKNGFYIIYCKNIQIEFNEFSKIFNNSIRYVVTPVQVTEEMPVDFLTEIKKIQDKNISNNFEGFPYRSIDLLNLLASKIPNIKFNNIIGNNGDNKIKVYTGLIPNKEDLESLNLFLRNLKEVVPFEIIQEEKESKFDLFENPVLYLYSVNLRADSPEYEKRDEAVWFDNIDSIYNGNFQKENLFFYQQNTSCYVDYSLFDNINIRNHILLYDKIYMSLPIEKPIEYFSEQQKIHKKEILELAENGKLNFLLTQPEYRYDKKLIDEIFSTNKNAIISRRAISTLLLTDMVQLFDNYFIHQLNLENEIPILAQIISEITKIDITHIYDLLRWPYKMIRKSFQILNFNSPLQIGSIGVNNPIQSYFSKKYNKNLDIEFMSSALNIHIAHALNATYFPFIDKRGYSDKFYSLIMGYLLNFYKNSSVDKIYNFQDFKRILKDKQDIIDPIILFEINEFMSVHEFSEISQLLNSPTKMQGLIAQLSSLNDSERKKKITSYNEIIGKNLKKRQSKFQYLDFAYSASLDTAGIWVPFIGTGLKGIEIVLKKLKILDESKINQFIYKINNIFIGKDVEKGNIDFLTKINRVARLKDDYK